MTIFEFNKALQQVDFIQLANTAIMENEPSIIDAITEGQMQLGRDANGDRIGNYMNYSYEVMKHQMNPRAGQGFVDLKLTGDFYSGMAMKQAGKDFIVRSSDSKDAELRAKYGNAIEGLSRENSGMIAQEYILPDFLKSIRNGLSL